MTHATVDTNVQQLTEYIHDWRGHDVHVDQTRRLVQNVALTGTRSKNGYRYSQNALRAAVSLYENKPVFLDHAVNVSRPFERSTRDLAGSIVRPRFENGRIRGDIQLLDTEAGNTLLALAETKNSAAGMSHVVLAERSTDQSVVEAIRDVISVDAVVFPATSSTFQESTHSPPGREVAGSYEAVLAEIDAQLSKHVKRLMTDIDVMSVQRLAIFPGCVVVEACAPPPRQPQCFSLDWRLEDGRVALGKKLAPLDVSELDCPKRPLRRMTGPDKSDQPDANSERVRDLQSQLQSAIAERDALRAQLQRIEHEQRAEKQRREVEQLLEASRLPPCAVTDMFRRQLIATPDADTRRALIRERQTVLAELRRQAPLSRERLDGGRSDTEQALIAAIRGGRRFVLSGTG